MKYSFEMKQDHIQIIFLKNIKGAITIKRIISIMIILLVLFVLSGAVSAANPDGTSDLNTTFIDNTAYDDGLS